MSDQPPATPPGPNPFVAALLLSLGTLLLLPGLCSLGSLFGDLTAFLAYGAIRSSGVDQMAEVIGLLLGALGVGLIAFAIRRERRS